MNAAINSFGSCVLLLSPNAVACHRLTAGRAVASPYQLVRRALSWQEARRFCRTHHTDLAVLSNEGQYRRFLNATAAETGSFWLGLQRHGFSEPWAWVDGEPLGYGQWYRVNYLGGCASLEADLPGDKKLLARYCEEKHWFVCQGPILPQSVVVESVWTDHVVLSWNVSAFMQMQRHYYNVTICTAKCNTSFYQQTSGSSSTTTINLSNLTAGTEYFIYISSTVNRTSDNGTGEHILHHSNLKTLIVKTVEPSTISVKLLNLFPLAAMIFAMIYWFQRRDLIDVKVSDPALSPEELSTEDTLINLMPDKTPEFMCVV